MRIVQEPNFEIDAAVLAKLKEKYSEHEADCVEFNVDGNRVQFLRSIIREDLKLSEDEAKDKLGAVCGHFIQVCHDFKIPRKPANIRVLSDENLRTAVHLACEDESDATPWGLILLPQKGLRSAFEHTAFTFLHELGHCWVDIPVPTADVEVYGYEMFVNTVAMSSLRRFLPYDDGVNDKRYRDVVDKHSYIAEDQMIRLLGYKLQRHIINNPDDYFKLVWKK